MSLAEEMLATMSVSDDSVSYLENKEPHIVINESRQAIVPAELKTIAVTGDKDIETISFDCVRYWDGNDLSTFAIYLNYVLPDLTTGTYIPEAITTGDGDEFYHFDWKIKNNITQKNGKISFAITAIKTKQNEDGETVVDKKWGSIPNGDCFIALGLDISNVPDEEESSDILAQMSAILEQINSNVEEWTGTVVVQSTGTSQTKVMSQQAATKELDKKLDKSNLVQTSGNSETLAMSQKQVTNSIKKDSVNLFNKNTAHVDVIVDNGVEKAREGYFASDFIEVEPSKEYYITVVNSKSALQRVQWSLLVSFYDDTMTYIDEVERTWKFTTPSNAKYLRFTLDNTVLNNAMLTTEIVTEYHPYTDRVTFDYDMIDFPVVVGVKSPNIVNPNKLIDGLYVSYLDGSIGTGAGYCVTPYIKVNGNKTLYSNTNSTVGYTQSAFYDADGVFISGVKDVTKAGVEIPENAVYVRCSIPIEHKSIRMYAFEEIKEYIPYGAYIPETQQKVNKYNKTTCKIFKRVCCCGDSFTSGHMTDPDGVMHTTNEDYSWVHYMATATGNEWINCGQSGANVLTWQTSDRGLIKAQASGTVQAYIIGLMLNDASGTSRSVELGSIDDIGTDAETYYGGMSKIIRELNAISPKAKIFVQTCPEDSSKYTKYNQAVYDIVAEYKETYPVHCLDLAAYKDLYNVDSLTADLYHGHYTAVGYEQFAEILMQIMSDYINANIKDFQDVAFI